VRFCTAFSNYFKLEILLAKETMINCSQADPDEYLLNFIATELELTTHLLSRITDTQAAKNDATIGVTPTI